MEIDHKKMFLFVESLLSYRCKHARVHFTESAHRMRIRSALLHYSTRLRANASGNNYSFSFAQLGP